MPPYLLSWPESRFLTSKTAPTIVAVFLLDLAGQIFIESTPI
jgi:hypothetical protein